MFARSSNVRTNRQNTVKHASVSDFVPAISASIRLELSKVRATKQNAINSITIYVQEHILWFVKRDYFREYFPNEISEVVSNVSFLQRAG